MLSTLEAPAASACVVHLFLFLCGLIVNYYCSFFNSIKDIKIIDLTNFLSKKNIKKIYLDEEHGGHLTAYGNRVVTKKIQEELNYA